MNTSLSHEPDFCEIKMWRLTFVPAKVWPTCGFVQFHPSRPYKWRSSCPANRYSPIPHHFPQNLRAELRIDLQDDWAESALSVTWAADVLLVAPWLLSQQVRTQKRRPAASDWNPDTANGEQERQQTCQFLPVFQTVFVDLMESQIMPSCWDSAHNGLFLFSTKSKRIQQSSVNPNHQSL